MQRSRQADSLQGVITSFKHFEKKLDKLQDDVNYHGKTLAELRTIVTTFAGSLNLDKELLKRGQRQTAGVQYERTRRPEALTPLANKLKAKSFPGPKFELKTIEPPILSPKNTSTPTVHKKHHRPRKAETPSPSKTVSLKSPRIIEKKRNKRK